MKLGRSFYRTFCGALLAGTALTLAACLAIALVFRPARAEEEAQAAVVTTIAAPELVSEFAQNMPEANQKYAGQLLAIKGKVQEIARAKGRQRIVLFGANGVPWSVECTFHQEESLSEVHRGKEVVVTGTVELRTSGRSHLKLYACRWGEFAGRQVALTGQDR